MTGAWEVSWDVPDVSVDIMLGLGPRSLGLARDWMGLGPWSLGLARDWIGLGTMVPEII